MLKKILDKNEIPVEGRLPDETEDIVTLSGGYTVGNVYPNRKCGVGRIWCRHSPVFDNMYFKDLLDGEKEDRLPPPTYKAQCSDPWLRNMLIFADA
ncbi:hypothetical protein L1987_29779 [Smallanthus sonchifolius]|uniref:Uncharacterized protein n=1 Tax=Smallanthus sonchifolius TaxID=185202 RepID=A0ACB9I0C1_9ASTR|nr:hypothetical protein L1987_29779 [Smallanthus sonchifolius]